MSKYHNKRVEYQGIRFASLKERDRYRDLSLLERAGEITALEIQPRYDLIVNGHNCGFYRGDFRYVLVATGETVVEDVKSVATRTAVYRLKKKLLRALYDIEITET